ncbi:MAG: SDR family NAD(P)-dependent oxidoreductase [Alphaproteobacteria bacterium]
MEFKNIPALVTGGGSGLGAATARMLAQSGAKVTLLDRNRAAMESVAKEIGALALECDVTNEASVKAALATAGQAHGVARILINCAGILGAGRILGREGPMPLDFFAQVLTVNVVGTFNLMRLAADAMSKEPELGEAKERGIIINTASIAAYEGQIGQAAYAASKGAVVSLTLPAARELAKFGIRVNAIAPGPVDTPMVAGMPADVRASLEAGIPFPSRLIRPQEFAALARHLIENVAINGEVVRLDGALRMAPK